MSSSGKYRVAVTGASGFLAAHLLRYVQENSVDLIEEVRCIDRRPHNGERVFGKQPSTIPVSCYTCELADSSDLRRALTGVDVVLHLARKSMDYYWQPTNSSRALAECYIRDNVEATEHLLDAMFACNVECLVYVGDAYANLPPVDNFGISEMLHNALPSTYLLGEYGETRARAELHARARCREKLPNGRSLNAVFLRPTFVYGEGETKFASALTVIAKNNGGEHGRLMDFGGRSLHQYMYAGNLAAVMDASMRCLLSHPERCSGEFFYCMDDSKCERLVKFFAPLIDALGLKSEPVGRSYYWTYAKCVASELLNYVTGTEGGSQLSSTSLRWLYGLAFGFSNRKQALILHDTNRPVCDQDEALRRTAEWFPNLQRRERVLIGDTIPTCKTRDESMTSFPKLEPNKRRVVRTG